jgi:hypothetical protein
VLYDEKTKRPVKFGVIDNESLRLWMYDCEGDEMFRSADKLAIEWISCYGMAVGREVFETCAWVGRFEEAWNEGIFQTYQPARRIIRPAVKLHLCNNRTANDKFIREAILYRYGGPGVAVGIKKAPGPLYGVATHVWPALAVAITAAETIA